MQYCTFNYPNSVPGSKTLLTGIRPICNDNVYISGFYENVSITSFIYKGDVCGNGTWHTLKFPNSEKTNLYGPNNGLLNNIEVVGDYVKNGVSYGCLYQGPLSGIGNWTTLKPTSDTLNTIAHSTMGGLVVGNYQTQLDQGKAFIYDIITKNYYFITYPDAISITAYGIWHNGGYSYTICGGLQLDKNSAYIVDWNNKTKELSNWTLYYYNNDSTSLITHFDGISGFPKNCYNESQYSLTGDAVNLKGEHAFYAIVNRYNGNFLPYASWTELSFPNSLVTSGNSVDKNIVIGVYDKDDSVNGYICTICK
jgi:hypothetical protein